MFIEASIPFGLWVVGGIVSLVILFVLFHLCVCFFEKFHIRELVPATPDRPIIEAPYFTAMNEAAQRLGFVRAGLYVQNRGSKLYQAHVTFWISQDGQSLLRVSGGKTAGMEIKRTWLTSFVVEPEKIIETADEVSLADLTGITDRKNLSQASLDQLVASHNYRLSRYPGARRLFPVEQALAASEAMQILKVVHMQKRGMAKFVNGERTIWKYTTKGAILNTFKSLFLPALQEEAP